ncbi:ABC transporter substrate-binding protein [candidate division WOR-3 bacterium]|uniref:ABC transporter substrate-binding protein n=1 Tax=candidate division WOR-3 bacterium TaxID=2052148 RepID=A0A937XDW0_UNCW3|nr:ABC transporter substrate-binding protein [candidate division WOR-3 bacterium]
MKKLSAVLTAAAVIAVLSCGGNTGTTGAGSGVIKVGLIVPLTGDVKTFGESTRNGAMLAIDEVNAAGGVNGRKIGVVATDDKNDPTEAGNAGAKLIDMDRVVAIIGSVSSKCSAPLSDKCQSVKIPMITPTSTAPKVTVGEDGRRKDFVFRACFIDPFQGTVAAKFAAESLQAKTAAVMYDVGNDYSKGLADYFKVAFEKTGGKITGFESYAKDDVDFSALLTKVRQSGPDVLFIPDYYNKVGLIAKQARQLGVAAKFLGGDGWDSPEMAKIAGDAIVGGCFTNHYSPDDPRPEVQEWVRKYQAKYGQKPDALATLGYDAALLLIQALKSAPNARPEEIKAALGAIKDFPCVSGKITFDEWGNPIKSAAVLAYTKDGQRYVTTINP